MKATTKQQQALSNLYKLGELTAKYKKLIDGQTLTEWVMLADNLGVARNNRNHAAKVLALQEMQAMESVS